MKRLSLNLHHPHFWGYGTFEFVEANANWGFPERAGCKPWVSLCVMVLGFGFTATYWPRGEW